MAVEQRPAILVTGAAKRLGQAMAEACLEAGYQVVVHCHHSIETAQEWSRPYGPNVWVIAADLASEQGCQQLMAQACAHFPNLGIVVHSASLFEYDRAEDFRASLWDQHMAVNTRAPALIAQVLHRHLLAENRQGLLVNIIDNKVLALNPDYFSYTISKYALLGLTQTLAQALAPNLRVCGIAPSLVLVSGAQSEQEFQAVHGLTLTQKGVTPNDLVRTLFYLIDNDAINGAIIPLDGGQHLMGLPRDVAFLKK